MTLTASRNELRPEFPANPETFAYTTEEYIDTLTEHISLAQPGDKVVFTTMGFGHAEGQVAKLMDVATEAAGRGVEVGMGVGAFTFMFDSDDKLNGPLYRGGTLTSTNPYYTDKLQSLHRLEEAGGTTAILNMPRGLLSRIPHAGHSHTKAAAILPGDANSPTTPWFAIGGANLMNVWVSDVMTGGTDPHTSKLTYRLLSDIIQHGNVRKALGEKDLSIDTGDNKLLVDVGVPGQSLILDEAVSLVDEAEEWVVTASQYPPSGPLAKALARALKRDVRPYHIHNHPKNSRLGGRVMGLLRAIDHFRLPSDLFQYHLGPDDNFVHAKMVATEKGSLVSSHNGVQAGVVIGTAEMGLLRRSPEASKMMVRKLLACVAWQGHPDFDFVQTDRLTQ